MPLLCFGDAKSPRKPGTRGERQAYSAEASFLLMVFLDIGDSLITSRYVLGSHPREALVMGFLKRTRSISFPKPSDL